MAKTYKNPPLLEAVCEFRFNLPTEYTEKQVGIFYEKIKEHFPTQKKGKMHKVEVKIDPKKTPEENQDSFNHNFHEFEQFFSEDEKYSVQLDGGRVSVHRIKPYTAWSEFFPLIKVVYDAYNATLSPQKLHRIGIRYVNEIMIPVEDFSFDKYFVIKASLPSLEDNNQKSVALASVFEQEGGKDSIRVQFAEKQSIGPAPTRAFILDFDYSCDLAEDIKDVDTWLNTGHSNLEGVFEGMITDETRKLFDK